MLQECSTQPCWGADRSISTCHCLSFHLSVVIFTHVSLLYLSVSSSPSVWARRAWQWYAINPNFLSSYFISLSVCFPLSSTPSLSYSYFLSLRFLNLCFSLFHCTQTDLESLDPRGRTPLHLAVTLGHLDCARVLLQHGADVSKENRNGWTGECVCVWGEELVKHSVGCTWCISGCCVGVVVCFKIKVVWAAFYTIIYSCHINYDTLV